MVYEGVSGHFPETDIISREFHQMMESFHGGTLLAYIQEL